MTRPDALILPFSEIGAADLPRVGGKGANLGEMTHAGFPVPPGFCLTTAAFRAFMAAGADPEAVYRLLDSAAPDDLDGVRRMGEEVRALLLAVPIPSQVAAAAGDAWRELGADGAYAVRSSATAEDLPGASFAGQQDTYLNVIGEVALLDAIRRCWVSLFTDRAILYRCRNGFSHRDVQLSVVVQQMIMAEVSGILFTADPVTGHRHTLAIDASFGLGEALVGGLVSPDSYRVDKGSRAIIEGHVADKGVAVYPVKEGGSRQVALPPEKRTQAVLTDGQILELANVGCRVEDHYGTPQDIEWAMADGHLYLLQARPITSLYPIDGLTSPDGSLHVYFSMGHQQNMTRAMSPLSLSSLQTLVPVGHGRGPFENDYVRVGGGRLFADLTVVLRHPVFRRAAFGAVAQFDALGPDMLKAAMGRREFQGARRLLPPLAVVKAGASFLQRVQSALWRQDLTGVVDETNGLIDRFIADVANSLRDKPAGREGCQAMVDAMAGLFPFFMNWVPQFVAGEAAKRLIVRLGRRWASAADLDALTLGLPGNVVTEMNLALGDLADLARQSPALVEWFGRLGGDSRGWLEEAARREGSAPFMAAWEGFLTRYGARGPAEIDIMMPRWSEEPQPLLQVIASHLQLDAGRLRAQHEGLVLAREAAIADLLAATGGGPLGRLRRRLFQRLYHVIVAAGGLREHHKFLAVRFLQVVKEALQTDAAALVAGGKLAAADDIWFLTWPELLAIWDDDRSDWQGLIALRRADLASYQKLTPPLVITSDGETPMVRYQMSDAPPGALLGSGVSAGVVEGAVRVIRDPQTETLLPGEVLVAEFTDPGWTPLFINAGGLIMEVGGTLNHGSVVAREYGIPAVVGVRGATHELRTGQRVRLDGNRGFVEIIDP